MYEYYNPNPFQLDTDDCTLRALTKALGVDWDTAHVLMDNMAMQMGLVGGGKKEVFFALLRQYGFDRNIIPNTCPDCYTAEDFANEHFKGTYILGFGDHVVSVVDGIIYDTWDSRKLVPHFYWNKKEEQEA